MPYWRCYYHIVWATHHRQPLITTVVETVLFASIERKCEQLKCKMLQINAVPDHLHLALEIPPSIAISDIVAHLKGTSSREINIAFPENERFNWQEGYSVHTFGEKTLPQLITYISKQKEHHEQGTIHEYLEQVEDS